MPMILMCHGRRATIAGVLSMIALGIAACEASAAGPFGVASDAQVGGFAGWVLANQAMFYRALAGAIRAAKTDGTAGWSLAGLSFAYGIFHAAGPGHGKAVISSYLLATEETWWRGVVLSFASALLQATVAILIVGVAGALIGVTAKMISDTARAIELLSYGLIIVLGARMLWVKGRGFLAALRRIRAGADNAATVPHACELAGCAAHSNAFQLRSPQNGTSVETKLLRTPVCTHDSAACDCIEADILPWGHRHGPEPSDLLGVEGWRRGASAVFAAGLRPCSGAIIVLVFAMAQGLFLAGITSSFIMGLGTGVTVAAIATLAVLAKRTARRLVSAPDGYGSLVIRAVEIGGAALVLVFGLLLLTGMMASERLVGF